MCGLALIAALGIAASVFSLTASGKAQTSAPTKPTKPGWVASRQEALAEVRIGNNVVYARLAIKPEERALGLSGTEKLEEDEGMLFVFENRGAHSFWMHGMLFDLDMLWIDDGVLSEVMPNRRKPEPGQSDATLPIFTPTGPATHVLEVNAGWAARHGVAAGDPVQITFPVAMDTQR